MYINEFDKIINNSIDDFYKTVLLQDQTLNKILTEKSRNFTDYYNNINDTIANFKNKLNLDPIKKVLSSNEKINYAVDIIVRYIAFYYFLTIGFYYQSDIKYFINNIIQYGKLQESSSLKISNFFNSKSNYHLFRLFRVIHEIKEILSMSELQFKNIDKSKYKYAVNFMKSYDNEYVKKHFIRGINGEIKFNNHNIIKILLLRDLYNVEERKDIFQLLEENQLSNEDAIYISVVIADIVNYNYQYFYEFYDSHDNAEELAMALNELYHQSNVITKGMNMEVKLSNLVSYPFVCPISNNFLRYHHQEADVASQKYREIITNYQKNRVNNSLNKQSVNKQEKERHIVEAVNKTEIISSYYSDIIQKNPNILKEINDIFNNSLRTRRAYFYNRHKDIESMNKILNLGTKYAESNEYFLEMQTFINNPYINFKDLENCGTFIYNNNLRPIQTIRNSNIQFVTDDSEKIIEYNVSIYDHLINNVGMSFGPFNYEHFMHVKKNQLVDVRTVNIYYESKSGEVISVTGLNAIPKILKIIEHFCINTINVVGKNKFQIKHNYHKINAKNKELMDKIIYWVYDQQTDNMENDNSLKKSKYEFICSSIYDRIQRLLLKQLRRIVQSKKNKSQAKIDELIRFYARCYNLTITKEVKEQLLWISLNRPLDEPKYPTLEPVKIPAFEYIDKIKEFKIESGELKTRKLVKIDDENYERVFEELKKCQHEVDWNATERSKRSRNYNEMITIFISNYAISNSKGDYVCKICGQLLPIKEYVLDGKFSTATNKFVSNYQTIHTKLVDDPNYTKYETTIEYLDKMLDKVNLITGAAVTCGPERKTLIKNVIDLALIHDKKLETENVLETLMESYHIPQNSNVFYYFGFSERLLDTNVLELGPSDLSLYRNKINIFLLYFLFFYITEITGTQLRMVNYESYANIFIFGKYKEKLFGDIRVRTNISNDQSESVYQYPILCYLVYIVTYYLGKYGVWYEEDQSGKYNPVQHKIIIHSFFNFVNSMSYMACKNKNNSIYIIAANKFYSKTLQYYRDDGLIDIIKDVQKKYIGSKEAKQKPYELQFYPIGDPSLQYTFKNNILPFLRGLVPIFWSDVPSYYISPENNNLLICPIGTTHLWKFDKASNDIKCTICGETYGENAKKIIDRTKEHYEFNIKKLSEKKCIDGFYHFYEKGVCKKCGKKQLSFLSDVSIIFYHLDKFFKTMEIVKRMSENNYDKKYLEPKYKEIVEPPVEEKANEYYESIVKKYTANDGSQRFLKKLDEVVGRKKNLDIHTYPVYLFQKTFVIDHEANGSSLAKPLIIMEDNKIITFEKDHKVFQKDVYVFFNSNANIDVFYDAIYYMMVGYKLKNKEIVKVDNSSNYLIIMPSFSEMIEKITFTNACISLTEDMDLEKFMETQVKKHIYNTKMFLSKVVSIINNVVYYQQDATDETDNEMTQQYQSLVTKYIKTFAGYAFESDNFINKFISIKNSFKYQKKAVNLGKNKNHVNYRTIMNHDATGSLMLNYFYHHMTDILEKITNDATQLSFAKMLIDIFGYYFFNENLDIYQNTNKFKRYEMILDASDRIIDLTAEGKGIIKKPVEEPEYDEDGIELTEEEIAKRNEEREELREEEDALDVEYEYEEGEYVEKD